MRAEFEEKTYEQHLTFELVRNRRLFFPPGQVLEYTFGFDVALQTYNRHFWRLFFSTHPPSRQTPYGYLPGTRLRTEWWRDLESDVALLPRFKFNCFIQAKRPDMMIRSDAAEYSSWKRPYFRYDTFRSQQKALESLSQETAGRAIVTYACPAFHTYRQLWSAVASGKFVRRSNFCEAAKLSGHDRYSFVSPGNRGIAHSKPKMIRSRPFERALDTLQGKAPHENNLTFLAETAEAIASASKHLGELASVYSHITRALFPRADNKLARSLAKIYAFQFVCNVQLLIGHE